MAVNQSRVDVKDLLPNLPDELLAKILGYLPQRERLLFWAPLNFRFRAIALAASTSLTVGNRYLSTCSRAESWLVSYGSAVTSIEWKPLYLYPLKALPCPALRSLHLNDCQVKLITEQDNPEPGLLHSCRALNSLSLRNCNVLDTPSEQLAGLSELTALHELSIMWDMGCNRQATQQLCLLPGSLLSQLVQLTGIKLSKQTRFSEVQQIGRLTNLQHLEVVLAASEEPQPAEPAAPPLEELEEKAGLVGIHKLQHLTCLHLSCVEAPQSMGLYPGYLTTLRKMHVQMCQDFDPVMLLHLPHLCDVSVIDSQIVGEEDAEPQRLTSSLLSVVAQLPEQLTSMDLSGTLQHPATALADYEALGALTELKVLTLAKCNLPKDIWGQLVSSGNCMPSVRTLLLEDTKPGPQLTTENLTSLVECFPTLVRLSIVKATTPGIELAPLQELHRLKHLEVSNGCKKLVKGIIARVPGLLSLQIEPPSGLADLSLLALTALTELTGLRVSGGLSEVMHTGACCCPRCAGKPRAQVCITNKGTNPHQPKDSDVPQQLMKLCIKSSTCQHQLLPRLNAHGRIQQDLETARTELRAVRKDLKDSQKKEAHAVREALLSEEAERDANRKAHKAEQLLSHAEHDLGIVRAELRAVQADLRNSRKKETGAQMQADDAEAWEREAARKAHRTQQLLSRTEARLDDVAARERHAAHREAHIRDWEQHMAQREAWLHAREREVAAAEARLGRRPGRP